MPPPKKKKDIRSYFNTERKSSSNDQEQIEGEGSGPSELQDVQSSSEDTAGQVERGVSGMSELQVTIDLELHLSKRTKLKSSGGPFAKYDVYLYRVPQAKARIPNGPSAKTVNGPKRAKGRVLRWKDDLYPPSPPLSTCSPVSTRSMPASVINKPRQPRPWTLNSYNL